MEIILKLISSHTEKETSKGFENLTLSEKKFMEDIVSNENSINFYYDGEKINDLGDMEYWLIRCFESDLPKILDIDKRVHINSKGFTKVEDITKDVLYSLHDTSFYGDKEPNVVKFLNRFKNACLTKDDILEKILELGIESINEDDKKILQDLSI